MKITEKMVLDAYKEKLRAGKANMRAKSEKPFDLGRVTKTAKAAKAADNKHRFLEMGYTQGIKAAREYFEE